jgi:NAD(P)-dependent dehydrogenase (short-subunit alcohol dehydrogenase family)
MRLTSSKDCTMKRNFVAVTGAAGTLGRITTSILVKSGYAVIGIDRAALIEDSAALVLQLTGIDLTSPEDSITAFARIKDRCGSLHALVNIAGGFAWETVEGGGLNTWDRLYKMNVVTALNAAKAALPLLLLNGGAIVNVSAAASVKADVGMGAYAASKSGVARLTESLAAELKHKGVRVNAVCPSIIDTPPNRAAMPDAKFDTWVKPDALADVIKFLISDQARAVSGALLPVTSRT